MLWVSNGLFYVIMLFATGLWTRIVPTSVNVFPEAWEWMGVLLHSGCPHSNLADPRSPPNAHVHRGRFPARPAADSDGPGYVAGSPLPGSPGMLKVLGGPQVARSLHFICHAAFIVFIIMHVGLVFLVHPEYNLPHMILGIEANQPEYYAQAFTIALITIVLVIAFLIGLSYWSLANRPRAQRFLVAVTEPGRGSSLNWMRSRMSKQNVFTEKDISEFHWSNGLPPTEDESPEWLQHRDTDWSGWRLELGGELNGETGRA